MIYDGRTQKEDVFFALGKLGGEAHVQDIYSELKDTWEQKYHYNLNERDAADIRWHHSIRGTLGSLQYDGLVENIKTKRGYWRIVGGRGGYITQREDYNFSDNSFKLFQDIISSAEKM